MSTRSLDPAPYVASALRTGRSAWRRFSAAEERRRRRIPDLEVHPADGHPVAYYLLPEAGRPQGGVRVAYRHVDLLRAMGWSAAVLHRSSGYRASWFDNDTPVVGYDAVRFKEDDVLVAAEWFGPSMADLDPRIRVLVLNQGGYITYDGLPLEGSRAGSPYADLARCEGIMTVSEDSADLLRLGFPGMPVDIVRPVVDATVFHPGPPSGRADRRRIAYAPSRRPEELHQVLHLLRAVGVDWPLVPIQDMAEREVAEALRSASIFLSLSDRDGFGLPPAEAMACGAYVVGHTGGGGEEFFDPAYARPVGSVAELVRGVREAVSLPPEELARRGLAASAAILGRYHDDGLREDLERVFTRVLGRPRRPVTHAAR